jgi:hypothetical protein
MMRNSRSPVARLLLALLLSAAAGCTRPAPEGRPVGTGASPPAAIASGSRAVVEEYLRAATKADGAAMYALLATSERKDETPQSLRETAADRYRPDTTWEIVKVEEGGSTSQVVVRIEGARKVDPNPYRFALTKEAGEWRIVQSPELHEDDDDLTIKLN